MADRKVVDRKLADLHIEALCADAGDHPLIRDVTCQAKGGALTVLLGPNGAGKTSLLRAALGIVRPSHGQVTLNGHPLANLSAQARAQQVTYLPQARPMAWPISVGDVVALGRYPHGMLAGRAHPDDQMAIKAALEACDLWEMRHRPTDQLSGGELARTHCARAFAAQTPFLLADEPTAGLDPKHQHRVMQLFRQHTATGAGALVVLHDISLAAQYADQLIWMKDGRLVTQGGVAETLTAERLSAVYGVTATVVHDGGNTRAHIDGPLP